MRELRNFAFLCLGILLGTLAALSHAETIAATTGTTSWKYPWTTYGDGHSWCNFTVTQTPQSDYTAMCEQIDTWRKACYSNGVANNISNYKSYTPTQWGTVVAGSTPGTCVMAPGASSSGTYATMTAASTGYTCPAGQNWTLSGTNCTRPDCPAPQVRNSDGTCPTGCLTTTAVSSGLYDFGTDPNARGPIVVCAGNCYATFNGTPMAKTALVAGVRHYYGQGTYSYTGDGQSCTPNGTVANVGTALTQVPASSCPNGQSPGTVNGVTKCYSSTGQPVAETAAASATTNTYTKTTNADNTVTVTKTTTDSRTNTSTTSTVVYPNAAAVPANLPLSETGVQQASSGGMSDFCAQNPTAQACVTINPGAAADTGGLYTKDASGKSFTSSVNTAKATITGSGFYNATAGFFQVGAIAGSCAGLSTDVALPWRTLHIDAGQYLCGTTAESFYSLLAAAMLVLSLGVAFAIAIL